MKCPHCKGLVEQQHDRKKCLICGRSVWREFSVRRPLKKDMDPVGRPTGSTMKGSDNIGARI